MKTREEVARFVEHQFNSDCACKLNKGSEPAFSSWHYGRQDVRELLDFIFEGEPTTDQEKIK